MRRWLRRLGLALIIATLGSVAILHFTRLRQQDELRRRTALRSPRAVELLEPVEIGGVEQWIFVRGEDPEAPLLLWLHGGPGSPAMPNARLVDDQLVHHFLVVHWDQRGAGKSFGFDVPAESYTVEQLVSDAEEVAEHVLRRFGRERLFLLGHSWGSDLGSYLVVRRPELFHAWISMGTDARTAEAEAVGYHWVRARAMEAGHREALEELDEIGPPPYADLLELATEREWLDPFGGATRYPERHGSYLQRIYRCPEARRPLASGPRLCLRAVLLQRPARSGPAPPASGRSACRRGTPGRSCPGSRVRCRPARVRATTRIRRAGAKATPARCVRARSRRPRWC
jgi:pimeloyl-ACP methyl ester carboxylesterase